MQGDKARRLRVVADHLGPAPEALALDSAVPSAVRLAATAASDVALDLTAGLRLLEQGGQADLCAGFFSARHPHYPELFLAPSHGTVWSEADPTIYGVYSSRTRQRIAGEGPLPNFPSTAVSAAIYSSYPEVNAIVHAHPRSVMALSAVDGPAGTILPLSEPSFMFYQRVRHLPCNFFFDDEYLKKIVEALRGDPYCIIMRNHSYIMTGGSVQECYIRSYMVEQAASVQLQLLSATGGKLPTIPHHDECMFHRRSYDGYDGCAPYDGMLEWPALVRGLDAAERGSSSWRGDREIITKMLDVGKYNLQ